MHKYYSLEWTPCRADWEATTCYLSSPSVNPWGSPGCPRCSVASSQLKLELDDPKIWNRDTQSVARCLDSGWRRQQARGYELQSSIDARDPDIATDIILAWLMSAQAMTLWHYVPNAHAQCFVIVPGRRVSSEAAPAIFPTPGQWTIANCHSHSHRDQEHSLWHWHRDKIVTFKKLYSLWHS